VSPALAGLTSVQLDAVTATATQTGRDAEELAVELFPLIYIAPRYPKD